MGRSRRAPSCSLVHLAGHGGGRKGASHSSLITFFIGLILALQGAYELRTFGALNLVATAVALGMTRELGPLITAILVIGRSGSAFAAEIGTMKVTEELDALKTMAIGPIPFLVTPKFIAMMVMVPCLTIWANFMGIIGGSVFGVADAGFTFPSYIQASLDALFLRDIMTGLIKSLMFASPSPPSAATRDCRPEPAPNRSDARPLVQLSCRSFWWSWSTSSSQQFSSS